MKIAGIGSGFPHSRGQASLYRVRRGRGSPGRTGGGNEIGRDGAPQTTCERASKRGFFRLEILQLVCPCRMRVGLRTTQERSAGKDGARSKRQGGRDSAAVSNPAGRDDWHI